MATYVSGSGAASTGSTVTVTAPTSLAAGNLLVAIFHNAANANPTYTATDWTLAGSTGTGTSPMAVFTKTATASEPASYSFTASGNFLSVVVLQYAGASGLDGTPVFAAIAGTSATSPTQTAAAGDGKVVAFGSFNGNTFTTPTGTAARASARSAGNTSLYCFDALSSPADSYTSTQSASASGRSVSLLLAPAATAGLTWSIWNGTAETPATLDGVWNGTTTVPGTASRY